MARDKLITIRIEGEKRDLFNQLAKSQNTDTASLLYDFISGCLDGRIDIGIVTGKKQRIDKIDNQIDSERIDKLETTTQEIGERLDKLSQKLEDWIWVSQRSQENNLTQLKDQINLLAIQLNSQKDSQEMTTQGIDSIDTDSQQIDDMEPLIKLALRLDHLDDQALVDAMESELEESTEIDESDHFIVTSPLPTVVTVETADNVESVDDTVETAYKDEPGKVAIGPVRGETDSIEPVTGEGMNAAQAYRYLAQKKVEVSERTLSNWVNRKGIPMTDKGDQVSEYLILRDKLYYPIN